MSSNSHYQLMCSRRQLTFHFDLATALRYLLGPVRIIVFYNRRDDLTPIIARAAAPILRKRPPSACLNCVWRVAARVGSGDNRNVGDDGQLSLASSRGRSDVANGQLSSLRSIGTSTARLRAVYKARSNRLMQRIVRALLIQKLRRDEQ